MVRKVSFNMTGRAHGQRVIFSMAGMWCGKKVSFRMADMAQSQKVIFSMIGLSCGQKFLFSMAGMCSSPKPGATNVAPVKNNKYGGTNPRKYIFSFSIFSGHCRQCNIDASSIHLTPSG
jgi:hypothetical protein